MTLFEKDAHIINSDTVYGHSRVVLERDFSRFGV